MESTWEVSAWQGNNHIYRQAISLVVSVVIVVLLLLTPIKFVILHKETLAKIEVKLVKSKTKTKEKIIPIKIVQKVVKKRPIVRQVTQPKPIKIVTPDVVKIIHKKPQSLPQIKKIIQVQKQLPSSVVILNSIKNRKILHDVSDDFKAATDNQFKPKIYVKSKPQQLVVKDKYKDNIHVRETQPMALGILKSLVNSYGLHPIDDKVKTQDMFSYCAVLGRASAFCPTSNPLAD